MAQDGKHIPSKKFKDNYDNIFRKKKRTNKRKTIAKITQAQIKIIEQEYWERYNAGIPQWQQNMY